MLIDTHCHLDFPEFDKDRDEVIRRAKSAGIGYIINIGSSLSGSKKTLELSRHYNFIYAAIGLHPHEADKFDDEAKASIEKLAREDKVVAIGETGLDYYRNYSKTDGSTAPIRLTSFAQGSPERSRRTLTISPEWNRRAENQKALFRYLVKLARDSSLPLVIHNRQAQEDTLNILNGALPIKAVVHCFSGDEDFLKKCLDLGFFISFTCNITYPAKSSNSGRDPTGVNNMIQRGKEAKDLKTFVKLTPLDRLMLETDAPFLAPEGLRGKRNEPAYVKFLAEEIARIKEVGFEEVARITTENARRFFNLK